MIRYNQPALFSPCNSDTCNEKQPKCQKAQYSDGFYAQFSHPKNLLIETNIVTNGDFATGDLTGWSQTISAAVDWEANGNIAHVTGGTSEYLYQDLNSKCAMWLIEFDYVIPANVELELLCSDDFNVNFELIDTLTGTGHYIGYWNPNYGSIAFRSVGSSESDTKLDNVVVYEVKAQGEIRDCCDVKVTDIDECDWEYNYTVGCSEPDYFDLAFNWSDYVNTPGKYKICIKDAQLIQNYRFIDGDDNWSQTSGLGDDWTFGVYSLEPSAYITDLDEGEISEMLYQDLDLPPCDYELTVKYISSGMDDILHVWINGEEVASKVLTIALAGTITLDIQSDLGWYYPITQLGFQIESANDDTGFEIDSISIVQDICSPCYCIAETQPCTLLFEARNNEDAFGFHFDTATKFSLRLESELLNFKSEFNEAVIESSAGRNQLYFSQFKHLKDLKIYGEAETVWQALEMMLLCTDFRINKIQYTKKEGAIEKTFIRDLQTYSGAIPVLKKTQNFKNYY